MNRNHLSTPHRPTPKAQCCFYSSPRSFKRNIASHFTILFLNNTTLMLLHRFEISQDDSNPSLGQNKLLYSDMLGDLSTYRYNLSQYHANWNYWVYWCFMMPPRALDVSTFVAHSGTLTMNQPISQLHILDPPDIHPSEHYWGINLSIPSHCCTPCWSPILLYHNLWPKSRSEMSAHPCHSTLSLKTHSQQKMPKTLVLWYSSMPWHIPVPWRGSLRSWGLGVVESQNHASFYRTFWHNWFCTMHIKMVRDHMPMWGICLVSD